MTGTVGCSAVIFLCLVVSCTVVTRASDNMPVNKDVSKLFPLTLIHINDLHARFEETNMKSNTCTQKDQCIAGIARVYHKIKELLEQYKDKNAIYLNAGDNFQGTLWYNLLRWEVTADFIKKLKPKAMTLGNHEFDHTPKGLAPYLAALDKEGIPTLVANLVMNNDPDLKNSKIQKSLKLDIGGKKIGIIGVLYDKTHEIAQTGKVTLSNAAEAVKREAAALKKDKVDMIVVLSHCSYDEDKKIATEAGDDIDVIVGAHSHSFLYSPTSKQPYDPKDKIEGPYPTVVESKNKRKIPIVQAKSFGKYVGRLTLYFDDKGEVKHWEGYPVFIDNKVKQDPQILKDLEPWRKKVEAIGSTVVGETKIELDRDSCRDQECTLGVLYADGFASHYTNNTFRPFAIIQAGNFRNPIKVGKITNGDIQGSGNSPRIAPHILLHSATILLLRLLGVRFTTREAHTLRIVRSDSGFRFSRFLLRSVSDHVLEICKQAALTNCSADSLVVADLHHERCERLMRTMRMIRPIRPMDSQTMRRGLI